MIWVVFAAMTGAAVLAFLWPLAGRPRGDSRLAIETNLYQAELADIERDVARGLMTPADGEAARTEAARRLLASTALEPSPAGRGGAKAASVLVILIVPILSIALYARLGAPDYQDMPLQARIKAQPADMDMAAALARIETHLAKEPDDARGWEILAQVYTRLERADGAARAWRNLIRLQGASPDLLMAFGQSLVFANQGKVSEEAQAAFEKALAIEPSRLEPRFYLALAAEQKGDRARALEGFAGLLADAPDAPFADLVRERIARLGGEALPPAASGPAASPQGAAIAAMAPAEREATIRGMVEGLAARLATNGGSLEEWSRLVRAYTVLREPEKARAALGEARKAFGADAAAMAGLDALAGELGLGG
jgi:cytochrome c-type biogenesis protein CcmH